MYVIGNGHQYIGITDDNRTTCVSKRSKAATFDKEQKAINFKNNLKSTLRRFNWEVIYVKDQSEEQSEAKENFERIEADNAILESLKRDEFDIAKFFIETVSTVSQLQKYSDRMREMVEECDLKILDIRHYKRDKDTKLNAVQLSRLEQFEIKVERERYKYKSNYRIADIFLADLTRLSNPNYIKVVKDVKNSKYKPRIMTFEALDDIVGKKRATLKK